MKKNIFLLFLIFLQSIFISSNILKIKIDGPIGSITANFVSDSIKEANNNHYSALLIEMNTPGGYGFAMKKIIGEILNSKIPVIVYVYPSGSSAASAGFFILQSAHVAVMCEGTNTGAAHPLLAIGGIPIGENGKKSILMEKIEKDITAYMKAVVTLRGRNVKAAIDAIEKNSSYTANEALKLNLIDFICNSEEELLKKLDGEKIKIGKKEHILKTKGERIIYKEMSLREKFLYTISNPNLAAILGLIGILGLFFEFNHPGFILPGVVGAICLSLALLGFSFLPINYIGVILIILAIFFFIGEIKVQGFGALGIGGIISMLIGFFILVKSPDGTLGIKTSIILGIALPVAIIMLLITRLVIKIMQKKPVTGKEALLEQTGEVVVDLSPQGKVFISGEYWDAISENGEKIEKNSKIKVVEVDGFLLKVKKLED